MNSVDISHFTHVQIPVDHLSASLYEREKKMLKLLYYWLEYQLHSLRNHRMITALPLVISSEGMGCEIVSSSLLVEPTVFELVLGHTNESLPERDVGKTTLGTTICERR